MISNLVTYCAYETIYNSINKKGIALEFIYLYEYISLEEAIFNLFLEETTMYTYHCIMRMLIMLMNIYFFIYFIFFTQALSNLY